MRSPRLIALCLDAPPGGGKDTIAKRMAAEFPRVRVFGTGEIFRGLPVGDPLGDQIRGIMAAGALVPDELTNQAVTQWLAAFHSQTPNFDLVLANGWPRTAGQAACVERMFDDVGILFGGLLRLRVSDDVALERLGIRREIEQRTDDQGDTPVSRLVEYREKTEAALTRAFGLSILEVDGEKGDRDVVYARVLEALRLGGFLPR